MTWESVESLHRALFPISYEEVFYLTALSESDGITPLCAVERDFGVTRIVGVVTARVVPQTDEEDREVVAAFIRRKRGRLRAMTRWLTEALAKTQPKGGGEVLRDTVRIHPNPGCPRVAQTQGAR